MTRSLRECMAAAAMLCCVAATNAQPRPVVVELFTSQGCSSCPPADAYVGKLSARSDVLALSFHVDYWDDLGWRDRFALAQSVERQNIYARNLRRSTVYTPQLVVDGRDDSVGSDGKAVARALSENRDGVPVGVSVRDAEVLVEIGAQPGVPPSAQHIGRRQSRHLPPAGSHYVAVGQNSLFVGRELLAQTVDEGTHSSR